MRRISDVAPSSVKCRVWVTEVAHEKICHKPSASYGNYPYNTSSFNFNALGATMATTATPTARFEARISAELHAILKRAAEIQDRTMTDFVVSAASEAAERTIAQAEIMNLSMADQIGRASCRERV